MNDDVKPKVIFEVTWDVKREYADVNFVSPFQVTPRMINRVFKTIKVRYRQYTRKLKISERVKSDGTGQTTSSREPNAGTVASATRIPAGTVS